MGTLLTRSGIEPWPYFSPVQTGITLQAEESYVKERKHFRQISA